MKQLVLALLMILPLGAFAVEVYRVTLPDGRVIFADRPLEGQEVAESVQIDVNAPESDRSTDEDDEVSDEDGDDEPSRPFGAEVLRPATPEEIAANRTENCAYAREVAAQYENARRLYRDLGNDEREYLSSDEIDQARAEAAENVAIWCR